MPSQDQVIDKVQNMRAIKLLADAAAPSWLQEARDIRATGEEALQLLMVGPQAPADVRREASGHTADMLEQLRSRVGPPLPLGYSLKPFTHTQGRRELVLQA